MPERVRSTVEVFVSHIGGLEGEYGRERLSVPPGRVQVQGILTLANDPGRWVSPVPAVFIPTCTKVASSHSGIRVCKA